MDMCFSNRLYVKDGPYCILKPCWNVFVARGVIFGCDSDVLCSQLTLESLVETCKNCKSETHSQILAN